MRVVAGTVGGRCLRGPSSSVARPTTDKVREAVFNSLASRCAIEGASVLDLFAGTGACGIEALSRGATQATFVDNDRDAIAVIRENLATLDLQDRATVVIADVMKFLEQTSTVDIAFVDPPYVFDDWIALLSRLRADVTVCESDRSLEAPDMWELVRERKYGGTIVTVLEARAA